MKKLLGLLAVSPLAVTACGGAANDRTTIVLYADFDTDDTTYNRIITEFESEHNVDVILETGSAYTLAQKMATEIDNDLRIADGFFSKNSMVQNAYSSYFDVLSDEYIDWDGLVAGSGQVDKKFAGITYKTRIISSSDANTSGITLEDLFAQPSDVAATTVGMRWSGSYMAANLAAYYGAIATQEDGIVGSTRLEDFKANVEGHATSAAVIEDATQGTEGSWNARKMLVSQAKEYVGYALTNTYYFNRIEYAQNFNDESLQGTDGKVATKEQWDALDVYYPDQGAGEMGAYTDFNSGSVVSGTEHGDLIEQLIAKMQQPGIQMDLWSEYEYYPANMGEYTRTDTALGSDVVFNNMPGEANDFKSMNVEIGYNAMGAHWDEAVKWIESFGKM